LLFFTSFLLFALYARDFLAARSAGIRALENSCFQDRRPVPALLPRERL